METLDQIMFDILGTHFLEPQTRVENKVAVKPQISQKVQQDIAIKQSTLAKRRITAAAKPRLLDKGGIGNTLKRDPDSVAGEYEGRQDMDFQTSQGNAYEENIREGHKYPKGTVKWQTALPRNISAAMKVACLEADPED